MKEKWSLELHRSRVLELPQQEGSDKEILWHDDMMLRVKTLVFKEKDSEKLESFFLKFMSQLKNPTSDFCTLLAAAICNMTNIFSNLEEDFINLDAIPEDKRIVLDLDSVALPNFTTTDVDTRYASGDHEHTSIETGNEGKFWSYFSGLTMEQKRGVCGYISLALVRSSVGSPASAALLLNEKIYRQWGRLTLLPKPDYAFPVPLEVASRLVSLMKNGFDHIRRILVILLWTFGPPDAMTGMGARLSESFLYFIRLPLAYRGLQMMKLSDTVTTNTLIELKGMQDLISEIGNEILKKQFENYLKIRRYISLGWQGDEVIKKYGIKSKFFQYSRVIDGRMFCSLAPRENRELMCFLVGLSGESLESGHLQIPAIRTFGEKEKFSTLGNEIYKEKMFGGMRKYQEHLDSTSSGSQS